MTQFGCRNNYSLIKYEDIYHPLKRDITFRKLSQIIGYKFIPLEDIMFNSKRKQSKKVILNKTSWNKDLASILYDVCGETMANLGYKENECL